MTSTKFKDKKHSIEKIFKDTLKAFNNFKNKQKACGAVYFQKVY